MIRLKKHIYRIRLFFSRFFKTKKTDETFVYEE